MWACYPTTHCFIIICMYTQHKFQLETIMMKVKWYIAVVKHQLTWSFIWWYVTNIRIFTSGTSFQTLKPTTIPGNAFNPYLIQRYVSLSDYFMLTSIPFTFMHIDIVFIHFRYCSHKTDTAKNDGVLFVICTSFKTECEFTFWDW